MIRHEDIPPLFFSAGPRKLLRLPQSPGRSEESRIRETGKNTRTTGRGELPRALLLCWRTPVPLRTWDKTLQLAVAGKEGGTTRISVSKRALREVRSFQTNENSTRECVLFLMERKLHQLMVARNDLEEEVPSGAKIKIPGNPATNNMIELAVEIDLKPPHSPRDVAQCLSTGILRGSTRTHAFNGSKRG